MEQYPPTWWWLNGLMAGPCVWPSVAAMVPQKFNYVQLRPEPHTRILLILLCAGEEYWGSERRRHKLKITQQSQLWSHICSLSLHCLPLHLLNLSSLALLWVFSHAWAVTRHLLASLRVHCGRFSVSRQNWTLTFLDGVDEYVSRKGKSRVKG